MFKTKKADIKFIFVLCLLILSVVACSSDPQSSPEKTAKAIMEAASAGNQNQLNELTIGDLQDHFIHDWLIERCRGVSISDLTIQDGGDAGGAWNAQRYEVYRDAQDVVTLYVTKIGDKYYMNNAYFGQENACRDSEYGRALDNVVMDIPAEPTPRPTSTPTSSGSYNIKLEEDTVDVEYDRSNGDYKVSFWIKNNGRKIARIYTSGCAYFEIDGSGEPTGEYICSQPPSWGDETVWIDPGRRGLAVFNYDNRTGKQAVQVCATLYNTIGYYDNGGTIIGEWKMDESLPCIHETN